MFRAYTKGYEADTSAGDTVEVGIDPMSAPIVEEEIVELAEMDSFLIRLALRDWHFFDFTCLFHRRSFAESVADCDDTPGRLREVKAFHVDPARLFNQGWKSPKTPTAEIRSNFLDLRPVHIPTIIEVFSQDCKPITKADYRESVKFNWGEKRKLLPDMKQKLSIATQIMCYLPEE
ncbi:hypothetical protein Tco_0352689 [Tanacetum coccineum]